MAKFLKFTAWQVGKDGKGAEMRRSFPFAVDPVHIAAVAQNAEEPEMAFLTLSLAPADVVMVSGRFADVLETVDKARAQIAMDAWAAK